MNDILRSCILNKAGTTRQKQKEVCKPMFTVRSLNSSWKRQVFGYELEEYDISSSIESKAQRAAVQRFIHRSVRKGICVV
jgi:hypothetical protein